MIAVTWWHHQMETFSALLAICAGNSPVPGEFTTQRPVTRSFDVFFYLRLNKRLSKQSWGWWFETLSLPLWRQCNELTGASYFLTPFLTAWRLVFMPVKSHDRKWLSTGSEFNIYHCKPDISKLHGRCVLNFIIAKYDRSSPLWQPVSIGIKPFCKLNWTISTIHIVLMLFPQSHP